MPSSPFLSLFELSQSETRAHLYLSLPVRPVASLGVFKAPQAELLY